jgi:uncharacterized protein YggL (DUF469 family)
VFLCTLCSIKEEQKKKKKKKKKRKKVKVNDFIGFIFVCNKCVCWDVCVDFTSCPKSFFNMPG